MVTNTYLTLKDTTRLYLNIHYNNLPTLPTRKLRLCATSYNKSHDVRTPLHLRPSLVKTAEYDDKKTEPAIILILADLETGRK
jgi:hypothetical protein